MSERVCAAAAVLLLLSLGPGPEVLHPEVALAHARAPRAPVVLRRPTITGALAAGATLAAGRGRWRSRQRVTYAYQWLRCHASCVKVRGADRRYYLLGPADVGSRLQVRLVASNAAGAARAISAPTAEIGPSSQVLARDLTAQLQPRAPAATVAIELVTRGYELPFAAAVPGQLRITWFLGRQPATATQLATGAASFAQAGAGQVRLELTTPGRALIQRLQKLTVTVLASYQPLHSPTVSVQTTFTLG